jgi:hypothetical protein
MEWKYLVAERGASVSRLFCRASVLRFRAGRTFSADLSQSKEDRGELESGTALPIVRSPAGYHCRLYFIAAQAKRADEYAEPACVSSPMSAPRPAILIFR